MALSISLTPVVSLLSIATVPALATCAVVHFMGDAAPDVSIISFAIAMFLITTLPVAIGVMIGHSASRVANRIEPILSILAAVLSVINPTGSAPSPCPRLFTGSPCISSPYGFWLGFGAAKPSYQIIGMTAEASNDIDRFSGIPMRMKSVNRYPPGP